MARVAILVTARPSWAKLEPLVTQLRAEQRVTVDLIAAAYALVHTYGSVVDLLPAPVTRIWCAVEGATLETSVQTTGHLTLLLGQHFSQTRPAVVVLCADRHETLAGSIAAAYQNIPILHLQGGEHSGNIDQRVRWANSMLADVHAVSTVAAGAALERAGLTGVHHTGCPSIDVALAAQRDPPVTAQELSAVGTGALVDPAQRFALVLMHPDTTAPDQGVAALAQAIHAVPRDLPMVCLWPGADAGAAAMAKVLRSDRYAVRMIRQLPPARFLRLLGQATLAIGNSSALVREGSALGIPRLLVGARQAGREWSDTASTLYGDGHATPRIVTLIYHMVQA